MRSKTPSSGSSRLRILMLIPQLGFGGAEGAFLRLAHHLAKDADVTIAVMDRPYGEPLDSATAWTDLKVLQLDYGLGAVKGILGKTRRWWRMLRHLRSLKRQNDIAISFLSGMNLLNALTGVRAQTIVSERGSKQHDIGMSPSQRFMWTRFLDPLIYKRAGCVVAASEGLAHELVTANPWIASRVVAIEGTVHANALVDAAELPVALDLRPLADCETIVAFGRLHIQKGYDVLLSAFSEVRAQRPAARLLLIGEGAEEDRLRSRASELGLSISDKGATADIIMPGMQKNPIHLLQLGRVFVLPSRFEGLPNALIEALAAGIPVLAADCPWGPRSILSDGTLPEGGDTLALPLALSNGTLMPLPDSLDAIEIWAREIKRAISPNFKLRRTRPERLASIARYDIEYTGPIWLKLAEEMGREAMPR
ncbi:glycosyltransferase [Sulfitobacter sp. PM12]|uniref:glycosyltransferase n=1 Tax=Sulfitobacter sp. PM12 TaxID=3138497 RepID=UPI00388FE361